MRERQLWEMAGLVPEGRWYQAVGGGMRENLQSASAQAAYLLSDRGTYLSHQDELEPGGATQDGRGTPPGPQPLHAQERQLARHPQPEVFDLERPG